MINTRFKWKPLLFIWIILPALFSLFVIATGAHMGASKPNAWYTTFALWVASNIAEYY